MRAYLTLIACAAATTIPVAASAETGSSQASTAESGRNADQSAADRPICRRIVATGSVMGRRVCRTRTEWDAITARSQSDMRRTQDQDRARSMTGGNQ
ncbi:MAG: hypothetical protein QOI38_1271 [Sphingomonadales bacterium]|jgi:hypothetical protein|nr:hypothetical protein [Sphingomonadales bacterium]